MNLIRNAADTFVMAREECRGPWERFADGVIGFCSDFSADADIFMNNVGCRHNRPIAKSVRNKIHDDLEIGTLIIEADFNGGDKDADPEIPVNSSRPGQMKALKEVIP